MPKDLAIVLANGSLNSAVAATLAAQRSRLVMVYVEAEPAGPDGKGLRRRAAFDGLVEHLKPFREQALAMPFLAGLRRPISPHASVDPRQVNDITGKLLDLLPVVSAGARLAAYHEASNITLGLRVGSDGPDLARATEYAQIFNELIQLPCGQRGVEVVTPLLELEPWQVVDLGGQVGCPMEKTWSCFTEQAEPCGTCAGCRARDAAFEQSGKVDALRRKP